MAGLTDANGGFVRPTEPAGDGTAADDGELPPVDDENLSDDEDDESGSNKSGGSSSSGQL
jgi:hypothetical protein